MGELVVRLVQVRDHHLEAADTTDECNPPLTKTLKYAPGIGVGGC